MFRESLIAIPAAIFFRTSARPGVSQNFVSPTTFCSKVEVNPVPMLEPDVKIIWDASEFKMVDFPTPGFPIAMTLFFTLAKKRNIRINKNHII